MGTIELTEISQKLSFMSSERYISYFLHFFFYCRDLYGSFIFLERVQFFSCFFFVIGITVKINERALYTVEILFFTKKNVLKF